MFALFTNHNTTKKDLYEIYDWLIENNRLVHWMENIYLARRRKFLSGEPNPRHQTVIQLILSLLQFNWHVFNFKLVLTNKQGIPLQFDINFENVFMSHYNVRQLRWEK